MNLIDHLGGYDFFKNKLATDLLFGERYYLEKVLLKYRRERNIFEVGDKVVHHKFNNTKIYEICEIKGDLFTVFNDRKSHSFKSDVRHATPEEIQAGRRI